MPVMPSFEAGAGHAHERELREILPPPRTDESLAPPEASEHLKDCMDRARFLSELVWTLDAESVVATIALAVGSDHELARDARHRLKRDVRN